MRPLRALLWDVDGTLAETERDGHRVAFNKAFELSGLPWRWDEARYGELLTVTGGRERLMHDMHDRADAPPLAGEREALARELHRSKNAFYAELVAQGGIPLRGGVLPLMQECREQGLRMGVVTTTSRTNVEALLQVHLGPRWQDWFEAVVCGEDVDCKKPAPEAYLRALRLMRLRPLETLALEDSPGGAAAACAAHCPVLLTRSAYFANAAIDGAVAIGPGLHTLSGWRPASGAVEADRPVRLADLQHWHRLGDLVSDFP
jgi:HAD superfamily hydrolase (TIGR01509 family)